jgi:hypothetical protein
MYFSGMFKFKLVSGVTVASDDHHAGIVCCSSGAITRSSTPSLYWHFHAAWQVQNLRVHDPSDCWVILGLFSAARVIINTPMVMHNRNSSLKVSRNK